MSVKSGRVAVRLSENGIEDVYLPLSAYSDKAAQIKIVYCRIEDNRFTASTLERAARELGAPLNTAVMTDYSVANLLALQSKRLMLFLLGILVAGTAAALFVMHLTTMYRDISSVLHSYDGTVPREQKKKMARRFALCLLYGMAAVFILWFVLFDAYVPSTWLQGGISFERFAERFISEAQKLNASEHKFLDVYIRRVLIWLYMLDILGLLLGIMLIKSIVALRQESSNTNSLRVADK